MQSKGSWFDGVYSELAELLTMKNQRLLDLIELSLHLPELKGIGCRDKKNLPTFAFSQDRLQGEERLRL